MPTDSPPNPHRIFQMLNAFQSSRALEGAIELGLFTALGDASKTAAELARDVSAEERGVRMLGDYLTIAGLLHKEGDRYRCAPDAAVFLDQRSPAYMGSVARFLMAPQMQECFADVAGIVRKGGTMLEGQGTVEPDHPVWVEFARSMAPVMKPAADFIAELVTRELDPAAPLKVLDVAAGHGVFGITIATRHPHAEVVALDWPAVLEVATENAARAGVASRHRALPGSAFETPLGEGYDVVLLTNFLHHFDPKTCVDLLRKVHTALRPGGRAVTLEFVPNSDRVTPPEQAAFALVMLASTAAGDAYTLEELERMAAEAGFASSEMHRLQTAPQTVVVSTKP